MAKVLVAGGTKQYDPFIGLTSSWLFDPTIEEWIRVGDMTHGRWYPSLVTLGDGRAIAVSGIGAASEIYSPMAGWSLLPHGTDLPLYPHLFLLADGTVFFSGGQLGQAGDRRAKDQPDHGGGDDRPRPSQPGKPR